MPNKPTIQYNVKQGRWEIRGARGTLRAVVSELVAPVIGPIYFVGSSAAVANTGSLPLVGTISGAGLLLRTDFVIVNPRVLNAANLVGKASVPSDGLLNFYVVSPSALSSYPAMSWDVLAYRRTA